MSGNFDVTDALPETFLEVSALSVDRKVIYRSMGMFGQGD